MDVLTGIDRDRIRALRERDEFFWLDLDSPSDEELAAAGELLELHPLALEDTHEFSQRPKVDRYPSAVLLVFWSARIAGDASEPFEVHLHISGGFLLTVHRGPSPELDQLRDTLSGGEQEAEEDIVYHVLDVLTDALFPVAERLQRRIDALEELVLNAPDDSQLAEIYRLKQQVLRLLRPVQVQHDEFGGATDAIVALPGLVQGKREYLHDVGDHLAQLTGELHRHADVLTALTSTYFNASANRLNRLVARLTVLATFFLIWTLVTSFFGQNFRWLTDHIDTFGAFVFYETVGLVIPTVLAAIYFWRRRREWL